MDNSESLPTVRISDPTGGKRVAEPIYFVLDGDWGEELWAARGADGATLICQRLGSRSVPGSTTYVAVATFEGTYEFVLTRPLNDSGGAGIRLLDPVEKDAYARLDTGYLELELCRGTAQGTGASKWGLRHFLAKEEGKDLLPSGNNAIGGFYGPFFTPENGLINPPEHCIVEIDQVEAGPVLHHYRMSGTIPDGLLPELTSRGFSIDWVFTYGTPYFQRSYHVDPFSTVINGRSVQDKITVGDEFESGVGATVFQRFEAASGSWYREGDPYAEELACQVNEAVGHSESMSPRFREFSQQLGEDIQGAHWDLYWRLFSKWEGALPDAELGARLREVRAAAHRRSDGRDRPWRHSPAGEGVEVSASPDQTIFPGPANKTVEYNVTTGWAMVWWTSEPSGAFQIVQRPQSGWVNWGTNGENECPELPVGCVIKTAYGPFRDEWERVADQLESAPSVTVDQATGHSG